MTCRLLIYDCDGVMFDSLEANFTFYQRVVDRFGLAPLHRHDHEMMRILHTYANRDVMAHLFPDEDARQEALRFAATINYRDLVPFMRMEPGFRQTLDQLQGRVELAVCTNRSTSMEMILADFDLARYFGCVMTAAQVTHPKPHPEPLLKVLAHYGLEPEDALFVGDSDVDRLAAAAAGIPFVAYRSDLPTPQRIKHHEEILSLL